MNDNEDGGNIIKFDQVQGDKVAKEESEKLPTGPYVIHDIDDMEWFANGFCIFTTSHIAIMKETPHGATPVLVVPLHRVKAVFSDDEDVQPLLPL